MTEPKRKRGRPPGPTPRGQRRISMHITLHDDEHEVIGAAAKAAKVKPTAFVRAAALRAARLASCNVTNGYGYPCPCRTYAYICRRAK